MVFSSTLFLFLFLPITLFVYFILLIFKNINFQNIWLLLTSLFFYFFGGAWQLSIMAASIIINYTFGIFVYSARDKDLFIRRFTLTLGIILNLGLLFWYKYFDFFIKSFNDLFLTSFSIVGILLPVGISFFTFQGITYLVDLHRGQADVQRNFIKIALYISLFPQLLAGPIVRYNTIENYLSNRIITIDKFHSGISRFIIGLAKKVIIANNVALIADNIFNVPFANHSTATVWLGIICYTIQIYYDFSGYSDMAIGLGRMLGFEFPENFNYPYISSSIREFWRRWHISLSSFFRDYLYIPIGGSKRGNVYFNLFVVFLATGLWHGAAKNFIFWGLWHGFFIISERIISNKGLFSTKNIMTTILKHLYTMLIVIIGWVIFRAEGLRYSFGYLKIMFGLTSPDLSKIGFSIGYYFDWFLATILFLAFIGCFPIFKHIKHLFLGISSSGSLYKCLHTIFMILLLTISVTMVLYSSYNPFIYFRF